MNLNFLNQIPLFAIKTKDKVISKIDQLQKEDTKYLEGGQASLETINKGLESKQIQDILNSLKKLLAQVVLGKKISKFTSKIITLLASSDSEIKRFCFFLLTEISYESPNFDQLLMCISPLTKTLTQPGIASVIKGDTLKTLCSLTMAEMNSMIISCLLKIHVDKSPYVKKIAAVALIGLCLSKHVEAEDFSQLFKYLHKDVRYLRGSVVHLSRSINRCEGEPETLEFFHFNYRKVCKEIHKYVLFDIVINLQMIHKYAFLYLKREQEIAISTQISKKSLLEKNVHPDISLLWQACSRLLYSSQPSIILEVAHILFDFPNPSLLQRVGKALPRFLNLCSESKFVILQAIERLAMTNPELFKQNYKSLLPNQLEKSYCKMQKIQILYYIVDDFNVSPILEELNYQIRSTSLEVSMSATQCIQKIAMKQQKFFSKCIKSLSSLLKSTTGPLLNSLVGALSDLIEKDVLRYYPILSLIFQYLCQLSNNLVKQQVIKQITQSCQEMPSICLDYCRILISSFNNEDQIVKLRIIDLSFKLVCIILPQSKTSHFIKALEYFKYVLALSIQDRQFKVRDRARIISRLVNLNSKGKEDAENNEIIKQSIQKLLQEKRIDFSFELNEQIDELCKQDNPIIPLVDESSQTSKVIVLGLISQEHKYRIGTFSCLLGEKVDKYDEYYSLNENMLIQSSTDDNRGEDELQQKQQREQDQIEREQRQKQKQEAAAISCNKIEENKSQGISESSTGQNQQTQQKKQLQKELMVHYEDTMKNTLNDFFEN